MRGYQLWLALSPELELASPHSLYLDNVFIERLWRSLKYECLYNHAFETGLALRAGLMRWVGFYNAVRPHTALDGRIPDEAHYEIEISALPGLAQAMLNNKLAA